VLLHAAYVQSVLANGHALEFFIEGGRSRDGAIQRAKLGLLAMVVAAVLDNTCPKVLRLLLRLAIWFVHCVTGSFWGSRD
jgi:glycerol-3-phosphate O-acyltransferase